MHVSRMRRQLQPCQRHAELRRCLPSMKRHGIERARSQVELVYLPSRISANPAGIFTAIAAGSMNAGSDPTGSANRWVPRHVEDIEDFDLAKAELAIPFGPHSRHRSGQMCSAMNGSHRNLIQEERKKPARSAVAGFKKASDQLASLRGEKSSGVRPPRTRCSGGSSTRNSPAAHSDSAGEVRMPLPPCPASQKKSGSLRSKPTT